MKGKSRWIALPCLLVATLMLASCSTSTTTQATTKPRQQRNYPGHIGYSGSNSPDDHHLNGTDSYNSDDVRGQLVEFTWHTTIRRHVEFPHEC